MNYITPSNHPESTLTGSTVESMIDRAKSLGLDYFSVTDQSYMTSVVKAYMYGANEKVNIKIIPGVELFIKDNECDIIRGTPSENIKYFKTIVHAKDQVAFQALVKLVSDQTKETIFISGTSHPLFNWADLEKIAKYNVSACTSDIEGLVSKHLLVDRPDLSMLYYEKLRSIFGAANFYPSLITYSQSKYWSAMVKIVFKNGHSIEIPASDRVEYTEFTS